MAALSVKVSARISEGRARRVAMRWAIRRVMTVVLPVPAPAMMSSGPAACATAAVCAALRPSRIRSGPRAASITGTASAPDLRAVGGQELLQLGAGHDGHVPPDRALERRERGGGVYRLLRRASLERGPEEARRVRVSRPHAVDYGDAVELGGPDGGRAGADGGARLAKRQRCGRPRGEGAEAPKRVVGRTREVEDRRRVVRSDE